MKFYVPAISSLGPNDLRLSTIPDRYVCSITTFVLSHTLPEGEYSISHRLDENQSLVRAALLERPYDDEQVAGQQQLLKMVSGVLSHYFGSIGQNHQNDIVLPRMPTQKDLANVIEMYNQSGMIIKSSSSLSLRYELFSSEGEIEDTLRNSGISIRKITALKEDGGTTEVAFWKDIEVQLYAGDHARFDEGLRAIQAKGFGRYLRPQEAYGLVIDILENKADPQFQDIFQCTGYEWLNLAWEMQGDNLIAYLDPIGLQWQYYTDPVTKACRYKYHTPMFTAKDKRIFSLEKMALGKIEGTYDRHDLSEFGDDFIQFHCGRSFADIPKVLRNSIKIDLPPQNFLVPVAIHPPIPLLGHIGCNGSPRGVRER